MTEATSSSPVDPSMVAATMSSPMAIPSDRQEAIVAPTARCSARRRCAGPVPLRSMVASGDHGTGAQGLPGASVVAGHVWLPAQGSYVTLVEPGKVASSPEVSGWLLPVTVTPSVSVKVMSGPLAAVWPTLSVMVKPERGHGPPWTRMFRPEDGTVVAGPVARHGVAGHGHVPHGGPGHWARRPRAPRRRTGRSGHRSRWCCPRRATSLAPPLLSLGSMSTIM